MKPASLYVHVPFCQRRCSYCDFAVQAVRRPPVEAWLDAVEAEAAHVAGEQGWNGPLDLNTVYVGGGTPSLLGPGAMAALRRRLEPYARWDDGNVEWTAEANPESFGSDLARDWRDAGVNRVSLGVQTFHEPALRWMGRLHGSAGAERAVSAARAGGLGNLSVDLIFGLPERLGRDWSVDLDRALALEPEHISLYGLTAEPATPLGGWVRKGLERLADEDAYGHEYLLASDRLTRAGFRHYEVSNFGRPSRESRHNQAYWTAVPYLGLGAGAHSFLPPVRRWNVRDWAEYRDRASGGRSTIEDEERLGPDAIALESIWLGLRTRSGVHLDAATPAQRRLAGRWQERAWAEAGDDVLRLTPAGWLLLDGLAADYAAAGDAPLPAAHVAGPVRSVLDRVGLASPDSGLGRANSTNSVP